MAYRMSMWMVSPWLIAAIEAGARDDKDELRRLVKSCPKKNYLMNDAAFSEEVQKLMIQGVAVEHDLACSAINYLFLSWLEKDNPQEWLNEMAVIQAAWEEEVNDKGINPATMAKAGRPRHLLVELLLDQAEPANPEAVKELRKKLANSESLREHI